MHTHADIDRWSLAYWIAGAGNWHTRWECTSADALLCILQVTVTLWVALEYYRYAVLCAPTCTYTVSVPANIHMTYLRRVFIQCLAIHVASAVLSWVITPYYIVVIAMAWNAVTTRKLCAAKKVATRDQEDLNRERYIAKQAAALAASRAPVTDTTQQLQHALTVLNAAVSNKGR